MKKRVAERGKKVKRSADDHTTEDAEEKKRLKRGKVDGYRGKSLIICLPISLPLNHKTTQNSVEKVAMWSR